MYKIEIKLLAYNVIFCKVYIACYMQRESDCIGYNWCYARREYERYTYDFYVLYRFCEKKKIYLHTVKLMCND